ncbi:MAG: hypothetical protein KJO29_00075, partial [Bacteroidia bacterium]|nr:hypothetical protein [Bacteroidia bacterium]
MDIDKIILKALRREASLEEYEMLEEWKHSSEQNLRYLESLMANSKQEHINYRNFDESSAWKDLNKKIGSTINYVYVTLAVISIAIVAYFVFSAVNKKNQYPRNHIAENSIAIVDLKDESKVHININSKLEQLNDFSSERRVALQGEA